VARFLEAARDRLSRAQRDLVLGGAPSGEHRDPDDFAGPDPHDLSLMDLIASRLASPDLIIP
jgi:hypothetical protein